MDMRRALNKRTIIVIVVILAVLLVAGGILVWRAASDTPESIVDPNAKSDELQDITYDTASTYKDSGSYAKGTINVSGVALDGTSFESLEIADGVGEGEVYLDNVSVTEELLVRGGGENSVYLDIASDGTKKTLDETNPGCSIPTVRVEKQNTHLVLGSQNIGELIMYSTNHVEIYGHVDKITVLSAQPKDHEYTSGIFVAEGASVGEIALQEQTGVYGAEGTVGTVTAAVEGLDVTVYPLPGTEVVPEETDGTDAEETDDDANDRSSTSTRRPSQSQNQNTGGGTRTDQTRTDQTQTDQTQTDQTQTTPPITEETPPQENPVPGSDTDSDTDTDPDSEDDTWFEIGDPATNDQTNPQVGSSE